MTGTGSGIGLVVDSIGNVGVGTTAPGAALNTSWELRIALNGPSRGGIPLSSSQASSMTAISIIKESKLSWGQLVSRNTKCQDDAIIYSF